MMPVIALSPVARVQRMISMLRKYCMVTAARQAQNSVNWLLSVMYGQRMNSPLPRARPARMMLGPIICRSGTGGGKSRSPSGGSVPGGMSAEAGGGWAGSDMMQDDSGEDCQLSVVSWHSSNGQ